MQNDFERKSRICRRYKTRPKHQLRANQTPIRNLHIFRSPSSKILHKTIRSRLQMRSHSQIPCNLQTRCNLQFRYNLQIPYNLQFRCNLPEQATLNHFDQRLCCSLNRLNGFQAFECFRLDLEFFRFRAQILSDLMFFRPGVISVQSHEVSAHTRQLNRLTKLRAQTFCSPKEDLKRAFGIPEETITKVLPEENITRRSKNLVSLVCLTSHHLETTVNRLDWTLGNRQILLEVL